MATNVYFSQKVRSEQNLYEDIIIESLKIYGQDVYYLPRDIVNEDRIFGDDIPSRFSSSYKVEMYIENVEGFDGENDLFTKFGVEIRDQATFIVARRRWNHTVKKFDNDINSERPREGDLIYLPLSNSLFQIMHVEHESPFYQISNLPTYKMRCELFEYNDEDLDTGIDVIDQIERDHSYIVQLTLDSGLDFQVGENVNQTLSDGTVISGEIVRWSDSDNVMEVTHFGGDDGKFHVFTTGIPVTSNGLSTNVLGVVEVNRLSENEQNDDFDTSASDLSFLDFTESNPFGDPQ